MKFYDTSALLDAPQDAFTAPFLVADMTLHELEEIKTNGKKDESTKYKARVVTRLLAEHQNDGSYTVIAYPMDDLLEILNGTPITDSNDSIIMATARLYLDAHAEDKEFCDAFKFVTSDLSCANLAAGVLHLPVGFTLADADTKAQQAQQYKGWTETTLADGGEEAMAMAYQTHDEGYTYKNLFNTPLNGYLLVRDPDTATEDNPAGDAVAWLRWNGERYVPIKYKNLNTTYSGKIKPLNDQQKLAFDLLQDQDITIKLLLGVYGSGKDYLMINHALDLIEKGKYDKIVWVRNNVEVKNTKEIGFLPGSMLEKVYPFAAILADCLGGQVALERAITDGWVEIQPLGFIRGRSFSKSIIYCSEAENLTKEHIQLLIGRVGDGSSLWINGDLRQVDDVVFERNNGIQKLIEKVTGNERFGTVYLPITERSETARIADLLD